MAMNTTLNRIRAHHPCKEGWEKLLKHLGKTRGDDEVLNLKVVVESNGLADAIWCMRSLEDLKVCGIFAKMCADSVKHLNNYYSKHAAYAAAYADSAADSDAAYAAAYAAYAAADADADAAAVLKQREKNKQFFLSLCD